MKKQIKVFGLNYEIEEVDEIDSVEEGVIIAGQIQHLQQKILIRKDLSKERKKVTLLHEILHAIFQQLGFNEEHDNEHLINSLSTALIQVLNDNKSMHKTLTEIIWTLGISMEELVKILLTK